LASRAGLHATYLSDLERGEQTPALDVVNRLARGLDVTLAEFFGPFDQPYRVRFRKPRRNTPRRAK
jgi:transcriptional regulator with XRE-family HTH domain